MRPLKGGGGKTALRLIINETCFPWWWKVSDQRGKLVKEIMSRGTYRGVGPPVMVAVNTQQEGQTLGVTASQ